MDSFNLTTSTYTGPLEALLSLIEERKLSISTISLAEVTDAYISYVEKLPVLPIAETSQFVLVASTLLLIKSRTLLPSLELSSDERESVEELQRRLARYAVFRKASKVLRRVWGKTPLPLPKRAPETPPVFSPAESTGLSIASAARKLINMLPKPDAMGKAAIAPVLALEDVIVSLKHRLTGAFRAKFRELTRSSDRQETIVYFLAILELVRSGSASVTQERLFEDILIEAEQVATPRFGT